MEKVSSDNKDRVDELVIEIKGDLGDIVKLVN